MPFISSLHFLLLCYFSVNFLIMVLAPCRAAADVNIGIKHSSVILLKIIMKFTTGSKFFQNRNRYLSILPSPSFGFSNLHLKELLIVVIIHVYFMPFSFANTANGLHFLGAVPVSLSLQL